MENNKPTKETIFNRGIRLYFNHIAEGNHEAAQEQAKKNRQYDREQTARSAINYVIYKAARY